MSFAETMTFKRMTPEKRAQLFILVDYDIQSKAEGLSNEISETSSKTAALLENTSALSTVSAQTSTNLSNYEARFIDFDTSTIKQFGCLHDALVERQVEYQTVHSENETKLEEQAAEINKVSLQNEGLKKCLKKAQKKAKKTEKKVQKQARLLEKQNILLAQMSQELTNLRNEFTMVHRNQSEAQFQLSS